MDISLLFQLHHIGKRAVLNIVLIFEHQVCLIPQRRQIFLKRQRQHLNLHIAAGQQCGKLPRQQIRIGTRDIDVTIFLYI